MEMRLHGEVPGDEPGLIDAARARAADIDLLKRGDVGPAAGDEWTL
jgi:hypothetical protein